jgi:hypothetical protein
MRRRLVLWGALAGALPSGRMKNVVGRPEML